jgi:hypothetical protein
MRVARVPLFLLLAYVCLDIANPLMPGAVHFAHGTIRVVEADRARASADTHIPAIPPPAPLTATTDRASSPLRRSRPVRRTACPRAFRPRRPFSRAARPPSDEDH